MNRRQLLPLLLLPIAAVLLLWYATAPFGTGVSPDTRGYLSIAHHLNAGQGVSAYYSLYSDRSQPIAAWPPLFPVLMSAGMPFGADPVDVAWVVNLVLFGANLFLAGWMVARTCRLAAAGWAVQSAFIVWGQWRGFFAWGLSEPLFILLINAAIFCLIRFFETGRRRFFVASALTIGFSELARYIGGVYIPGLALCILLFHPARVAERAAHAIRFGILASVPPAVWAVRNYLRLSFLETDARTWADRVFGSLMHRQERPNGAVFNIRSAWDACIVLVRDLFGGRIGDTAASAILIVLGGLIILGAVRVLTHRRDASTGADPGLFSVLMGLMAVGYAAGLVGALTFSDYAGDTPPRYLLPTATHLLMMTVVASGSFLGRGHKWLTVVRRVAALAFLCWLGFASMDLVRWTGEIRTNGADGTRGRYREYVKKAEWFPTPKMVQDFHANRANTDRALGRSF